MANYTLSYLAGVDYWIEGCQTAMFNFLLPVWNITSDQWNSYGRAYLNRSPKDDGYIPEVFVNGKDYSRDLFFNDKMAVTSFFVVTDEDMKDGNTYVKCQLLFFMNLSKITPNGQAIITQRLDDVVVNDITNFIKYNGGCNFTVKKVIKKTDKVLESFSGEFKRDVLKKNMQPLLALRFDLAFSYNNFLNQ